MQIGGIQKSSLIDYPGKVSSVIFCSGCNFDCPYCHNPDLVGGQSACPDKLDLNEITGFFDQRRNFLDGVVVSGGEPTLQPDLADLCRKIKTLGLPVKLDTNGSRPRVLQYLLEENLVDYVAMDLKTDPVLYRSFIKSDCRPDPIVDSIELIMESGVGYEFRTTCVKPIVTLRTIENILQLIAGARLYALQRFRNGEVLHPEFFKNGQCEYSAEEMLELKTMAEQKVDECIVR
ncbi:Ribonucleotide reductase of class III (anaerobic), activating protein (EC [Olavius sp. associated proteobacterium Delta 1]|nr:Ribonucleotide reductase of class III (anaerobic), activating protein (EC [Olavius sp. associated proteobacterium Delta 1]